uniref:Uncharacterized protein n=1 Tax=Syphacia muris TaxID=451379 RepID=A0A0N5ADY2_9BILA
MFLNFSVNHYLESDRYFMQLLRLFEIDNFGVSELVSENVGSNWCYHCASPLSILDRELAKVIEQLLSIRRSSYPANAVTSECSNPTNQTKMARQYCQHSYCSTIVLTDHETMNAFTMRGCAENFGAIDKAFLSKRGDNTCERLTEKVDVKECICKNRKYCYAGPQRKFSFETYEITDPSSDSIEGDIRRMIY